MSRFRMNCCVAMALSLAATSALAGASLTRIADGATLTPNTGQPLLLSSLYPVVDGGSVYFVSGDASLPTGSIFRHDPVGGLGTFADAANIGAANIASFSVNEGTAAYYADGNAIFAWDGATKTTIADRNTPYPLSTLPGAFATPPVGSFTSLGVPHIENDTVAFRGGYWGFGSGGNPNYLHEGIYTYDLNAGGPIEVVADIGTTAPGQANTFSYFAQQQNAFGFSTALGADEGGPVLDEAGNLLFVGFAPGSGSGRLITRDAATGTLNQPAFYGSGRRELDLDDGVVTQASGGGLSVRTRRHAAAWHRDPQSGHPRHERHPELDPLLRFGRRRPGVVCRHRAVGPIGDLPVRERRLDRVGQHRRRAGKRPAAHHLGVQQRVPGSAGSRSKAILSRLRSASKTLQPGPSKPCCTAEIWALASFLGTTRVTALSARPTLT